MSSSTTAWYSATSICFNYLVQESKSIAGTSAFIGDRLPTTKGNLWCFIISGGREQVQNYQVPMPNLRWYADATLRGQFATWEDAMNFASTIQNNMPVYKNKENDGQRPVSNQCFNRGIAPNVEVFEITTHPEVFSDIVQLEENKKYVQWWIIIINFRVVYNNNKQ